jgi:hypothetical protein
MKARQSAGGAGHPRKIFPAPRASSTPPAPASLLPFQQFRLAVTPGGAARACGPPVVLYREQGWLPRLRRIARLSFFSTLSHEAV